MENKHSDVKVYKVKIYKADQALMMMILIIIKHNMAFLTGRSDNYVIVQALFTLGAINSLTNLKMALTIRTF